MPQPQLGPELDFDPFATLGREPAGGEGATLGQELEHDPFADAAQPVAQPDEPKTSVWGQILEGFKGIPSGAVQSVGTALRGVAASSGYVGRYHDYLGKLEADPNNKELEFEIANDPRLLERDRQRLAEAITGMRTGDKEGAKTKALEAVANLPTIQEQNLWQAGEKVSDFGAEILPAAPGYEATLGRQVGEGLGSLVTGVAAAALPGGLITSTALFTSMGAGEAADRAVDAGASDLDISRSASMGLAAGATDVLPVEVLIGRLPIPGAAAIAHAVKKYGGTAGSPLNYSHRIARRH